MIRILPAREAGDLLRRKNVRLSEAETVVAPILEAVRDRGDAAILEYARAFDGFDRPSLLVQAAELQAARSSVSPDFRDAVLTAAKNIRMFAELQVPKECVTDLGNGHTVGQLVRPLETTVGYVPGGRYPLPSTVLMTGIPAQVAGVHNIWITTPKLNQETLAAAALVAISNVALIGGAQAIAAFAFGTETIPQADRIVGPGNIYVTAAKKLLAGEVGIDFVAGPTEVLIIAKEGNARWIAADMLAQAEHDSDAAAFLLTTSRELADQVANQIEEQLKTLSTAAVARTAIDANSLILLVDSDNEAADIANAIAPEHLCLHDESLLPQIKNAGSVFVGPYSPEAAGDYVTGPNHVLPTAGAARLRGGLSAADFVKVISYQRLTPEILQDLTPAATTLARAEGLEAHARSIEVRFDG